MSLAESPPPKDILEAYTIFETKIYPAMRRAGTGYWTNMEDFVFQPNNISVSPQTSVHGTTTLPYGVLSVFGLTEKEESMAVAFLMNTITIQPGAFTGIDGYSLRSVIAQATGPRIFNRNFRVEKLPGGKRAYRIETTIITSTPIKVSQEKPLPLGRLFIEDRKSAIIGEELKRLGASLGPAEIATEGNTLGIPIMRFFKINACYIDLHQIAEMKARQRGLLDQALRLEQTTGANGTYNIGQTDLVHIPKGVCLVIDNQVRDGPENFHLDSRLLDPGFEGSIRTEMEAAGKPEFLWVRAYNHREL